MITGVPTSMDLATAAAMPTHDPLVGRIVGAMLSFQEQQNKPVCATLNGTMDGSQAVHVVYQRDKDGNVNADGYVGSTEIHEKFFGVADREQASRAFGVSGSADDLRHGRSVGKVGDITEHLQVETNRSSQDVALTDSLRQHGHSSMSFKTMISQAPTFGGQWVTTNLMPSSAPTESPAIATHDEIVVRGQIGDIQFVRDLKWNITTWGVSYNEREGWGVNQIFSAEDGSQTEVYTQGDKTITTQPMQFDVANNEAHARGTATMTVAGATSTNIDIERSYKSESGKAAIDVTQRFGDHNFAFTIAAGN